MSSFFEKLKRGMEIEKEVSGESDKETSSQKEDFKIAEPAEIKKTNKKKMKTDNARKEEKPLKEEKTFQIKELKIETKPIERKQEVEIVAEPAEKSRKSPLMENSPGQEGELAVDVYQTEKELIIQSAIAGVGPENLEISMERDVIIIRGQRQKPSDEKSDYFTKECFWGPFSRKIIAPVEVDPNLIEAKMKEGILTIRIPKLQKEKRRKIAIKE